MSDISRIPPEKRYRGGSVPGHAPTNVRGTKWAMPKNDITGYQYGAKNGNQQSPNNGRKATALQRKCLEAIEREEPAKALTRFPPGMVKRFLALHRAACDMEHHFAAQAQRQIYEILTAGMGKEKETEIAREPEVIEVKVGRLEVPMPGAPGDVPPVAETKAG